jgi:hypothetical protein
MMEYASIGFEYNEYGLNDRINTEGMGRKASPGLWSIISLGH